MISQLSDYTEQNYVSLGMLSGNITENVIHIPSPNKVTLTSQTFHIVLPPYPWFLKIHTSQTFQIVLPSYPLYQYFLFLSIKNSSA